jgi:hypothetical protein
MRTWTILLGGLVVWTVHFLVVYGVASVLPGQPAARWLVLAATLPALVVDGLILWWTIGAASRPDPLDRWTSHLGATGAAISLIAVIWQCAPALLS